MLRRLFTPILVAAVAAVACGDDEDNGLGDDQVPTASPPNPGQSPPGTSQEGDGGTLSGADHDPCDGRLDCRRFVFVTSNTIAGSFAGGFRSSIARARDVCDEAATRSTVLRGRGFEPWLSVDDPLDAAGKHLSKGTSPYVLLDGTVIAASFAELASGALKHPIDRTEANEKLSGAKVWTGTGADGDPDGPSCTDWQELTGEGRVGDTTKSDAAWTSDSVLGCAAQAHLYCIEF